MMKERLTKNFKKTAIIASAVLAVLLIAVVCLQKTALPDNPITEAQAVSSMWVDNNALLADQDKLNSIENANISQAKTDEGQEEQQEEQEKDEETEKDENSQESSENQRAENQGQAEDGSSSGMQSNPDISGIIDIGNNSSSAGEESGEGGSSGEGGGQDVFEDNEDEGESADEYFRTSIINGDVVTDKDYSFTIKHLKPELTAAGISVELNGEEEEYAPNTGRFPLKLSEGKNRIVVNVLYISGKDTVTVSKGYNVFYAPADKVIIVTDLTDKSVDTDSVDFYAYGLRGKEKIKATVKVNGKSVSEDGEDFTVKLQYGKNTISITAGGRNDSITKNYTVNYSDKIFKVVTTISDTVLYGTEVQTTPENVVYTGPDENYKFKVQVNQVTGKEKIVRVRAYFYDGANGQVLDKGADGYYRVKLSTRGFTQLRLTYTDSDGKEHTYSYVLRFQRSSDATPADKQPTIRAMVEIGSTSFNLESGMTFKSPDIIINVNGKSYQNEQLYYNHFKVKVNDYTYSMHSYQSGAWFGYEAHLREGENTIQITAVDDDMYTATKTYKVYYTPGTVRVTVSVEATTVGLGYLIPKQVVEVEGGTSVAQIVTDLLTKYGYGYRGTGNIENGYYLAAITKPGITNGYSIPQDLQQMIEADGGDIAMSMGEPSSDSLGEFDFYRYSGWMYSYNGNYPGYSMSSCKPQDGAVIRVRFTLALGKDIGGFNETGGIYGQIKGNYGKEW